SVDSINEMIEEFWDANFKKIKPWYLKQDHSDDVIISASPEFLLRPVAKRIKVRLLIATKMDLLSGSIDGENCRGEEKVKRLKQVIKNPIVRRAYTDHKIDNPILQLAQEKYLVRRQTVTKQA